MIQVHQASQIMVLIVWIFFLLVTLRIKVISSPYGCGFEETFLPASFSIESVTGTDLESRTGRIGGDVNSGANSPKGPVQANAGGGGRTNVQSLMDVAEQDAANNPSNQHEKWRKLFYQMRIKLKPHDIAVRKGTVSISDEFL